MRYFLHILRNVCIFEKNDTMNNHELVLAKIQEIREAKKITSKQVAAALGLSESTYNRIESGKVNLTVLNLFKIVDFLEANLYEVFNLEQNKTHSDNKNNFMSNNNNHNTLIMNLSKEDFDKLVEIFNK